ncbi:alpha/beta hydrolase [Pseudoxanthomonas kalamensis DSM 18571]|uniref:alpha/beta hydrolase n=1 Tax=Pseudoxanthomonas kalamensis TaxID=289483 RepID=UPI001391F904|nr:alpha/beta hydrolase [Pseudoxanthomonas kalamensis]KAF1712680.1 alpha/beta hydrolase [Pseudoxanthomonas kalamensis DSM 18571]
MSTKSRLLLALVLAAAFVGFRLWQNQAPANAEADDTVAAADTAAAPVRTLGTLEFAPCALPVPGSGRALDAQCARFEVAENPAQPDARKIALNIAWLPPDNETDMAPDPVFFLAGGPGQAAITTYPQLDAAFREVRKHRSVILVDQRGTGESNPLTCPADKAATDTDPAAAIAMTEACRDALAERADLRFYTTSDAIRDLEAVREAIGATQINLVGVSYGTRVAQQYAMRYPQQTRSIVLDSVVPNSLVLGNIFARNLDDALALQFDQCKQDATCRERLGEPRQQLDTLLATLERDRPRVKFRDARSGELREERLLPQHVVGLVRMYAYMPQAGALLPVLIHEANQGRYEELMALAQMLFGEMQDSMAMGMQLSVVCSEDGDRIAASSEDEGTVLGHALTEALIAQCKIWPKGEAPADFHAPLATPVPALVLEGEFDPVTPPRYGKEVADALPNGRLLVLRGQGHNVIGAGCMPRLFAQFVERGNAVDLDATCLDDLSYTQPFTSHNGWNP